MKIRVFFILSSFRAGGAERVFWLLSQSFNKDLYEVTIVLLSTGDSFYSTDLQGVKIIDLKTVKASRSFYKLYNLIKREKPDVIFSTGGQVNLLMGILSFAIKGLTLIARPTNQDNSKFLTLKAKALRVFSTSMYQRFDKIVCQSEEIKTHIESKHQISAEKLLVIPNPVVLNKIVRPVPDNKNIKRLIVVARLTDQKGISRLLDIMNLLPPNYHLSIVGDGILRDEIGNKIITLNLSERVKMLGMINNVVEVISANDLFVLPSFIEGFPNVAVESLSVGTPIVSFQVGGISEILVEGFNGYIVEQNDLTAFKQMILQACERSWDTEAIRKDIFDRFGLEKVTERYQNLIARN